MILYLYFGNESRGHVYYMNMVCYISYNISYSINDGYFKKLFGGEPMPLGCYLFLLLVKHCHVAV